jgi:peroxiredoxin
MATAEPKTTRQSLTEAWAEISASDLSLQEKLDAYDRVSRALIPEVIAAYDRAIERWSGNEAATFVPAIGEPVPDFLFPDADGHLVSISSLLEKGPLVISLNRGHWCPYCRLALRGLAQAHAEIAAAGATIVSLIPETGRYAHQMIATNALPFQVLTDLDLSYALSLGLVVPAGREIREIYERYGIDLPRFQANECWLLPIPATIVVGSDGRVKARFVDPDFRHRMPLDELLAALRS